MATIPIWLQGRHYTSIVARYQLAAANGTLGDGTGALQTITGVVDEIRYQGRRTTENIVALTSTQENEVAIEQDDVLVITEILKWDESAADATPVSTYNALNRIYNNSQGAEHVLFVVTRGGNKWTFYGVIMEYTERVRKGKSVGTMTVQIVDTGVSEANPAYGVA